MNKRLRQLQTVVTTIGVMILSACSAVADMDMADREMAAGHPQKAVKHWQTLARFGLPEAQLKLGDYYVDHSDWAMAEKWYLEAEKQHEPRAYGRLGRLYQQQADGRQAVINAADHYLQRAAAAGDESIADNLLNLYLEYPQLPRYPGLEQLIQKRLARGDMGSQYILVRYYQLNGQEQDKKTEIVRLCSEALDQVYDCYPLLADFYQRYPELGSNQQLIDHMQQRWQQQRVDAYNVWKFAKWFIGSDRTKPQPMAAMALLRLVDQDYPPAMSLEADMIRRNPALGSKQQLLTLLQRGREQGSADAEYLTGLIYFEGKVVALDPYQAEQHLLLAADQVAMAHFYLGRIYRLGYLGRDNPQAAVQHYLMAGRKGIGKAYFELARYYWQGVGIVPNQHYAYGFAQLALEDGYQSAQGLITEITKQASGEVISKGQVVAQQERDAMQNSVLLQLSSREQE